MNRYELGWVTLFAVATAYEVYGMRYRQEATLSAAFRRLYRTRTRAGKALLLGSLCAGAVWLYDHLTEEQDA